ncbi:MAG TPA: protein-L-isoaspartate O-methyltransferase [Hellea balneolensis]|uniref:Protein-L-isoaspartate O-methyltransferase n=1 Tax=Hellea balneolensis TaxID=287478 RepID=A0A7C5QX94_9PROT|nr:protein-L-isoaspartate O-methyltransferase [Hellea balneolensis]
MSFIEPGLFDMIIRLRGRGISDTDVLRAMEQVPRSAFVPLDSRMKAYDEMDLPIACGQTLPAPLSIAIMLQSLDVIPSHKVLLVGAGSGYTAAVLGKMCLREYAIDRYRTLVEGAEQACREHVNNVVIKYADGRFGWRGQVPFDRILVMASVRVMPTTLIEQLKPDGKILAVVENKLVSGAKNGRRWKETAILPMKLSPLKPGKSKTL